MKRIAIVVSKNLSIGEASNVAAILGGAIASIESDIHTDLVIDQLKVSHAAVRFSHLLLKGGEGQIQNLAQSLQQQNIIRFIVFSKEGQQLFHSRFEEYKRFIEEQQALNYIGIVMAGEENEIKQVTKKFSLL